MKNMLIIDLQLQVAGLEIYFCFIGYMNRVLSIIIFLCIRRCTSAAEDG